MPVADNTTDFQRKSMKPRDMFLAALHRQPGPRVATGSATSVVTTDLMDHVSVWFPEAHLDAGKMAALAETAVTVLGFDNIMPLFSVWHESAALGREVDWGNRSRMPTGKAVARASARTSRFPATFCAGLRAQSRWRPFVS